MKLIQKDAARAKRRKEKSLHTILFTSAGSNEVSSASSFRLFHLVIPDGSSSRLDWLFVSTLYSPTYDAPWRLSAFILARPTPLDDRKILGRGASRNFCEPCLFWQECRFDECFCCHHWAAAPALEETGWVRIPSIFEDRSSKLRRPVRSSKRTGPQLLRTGPQFLRTG